MHSKLTLTQVLATATLVAMSGFTLPVHALELSGAGSTFASPLIVKWADQYGSRTGTVVSYRPIGSGTGIWLVRNRIVDFAVSDVALTREQLAADDLMQFPIAIGAVVPIYHVKAIGDSQLRLTGEVLAAIYLGKLVKWNDPRIATLNPGIVLPDEKIIAAHRADDSGTKHIFNEYLARVSPEWKRRMSGRTAIGFPYGTDSKGNERVAAFVAATDGSIGYVEYAFAKRRGLSYALLLNRDGEFVPPNVEAFRSALANSSASGIAASVPTLIDPPGKRSWPMTGSVYVIVSKTQLTRGAATNMLSFFDWAYRQGAPTADDLEYVPIPPTLVQSLEDSWADIKTPDGQPPW